LAHEDFKVTKKEHEANLRAIDEAERAFGEAERAFEEEEGEDPRKAEMTLWDANRAETLSQDSYNYKYDKLKGLLDHNALCSECKEFVSALGLTPVQGAPVHLSNTSFEVSSDPQSDISGHEWEMSSPRPYSPTSPSPYSLDPSPSPLFL
jgi:hypothetical protein